MLVGDTAAPLLHCQPLILSFFRQQPLHFTPAGCSFTAALIYTLQSVQLEQLINKRPVLFIAYCRLDPVECKHYLCMISVLSTVYLFIYLFTFLTWYLSISRSGVAPHCQQSELIIGDVIVLYNKIL